MIHYAEQMARKDISINGLRRQKKQLESQIRQLQDAIMTKYALWLARHITIEWMLHLQPWEQPSQNDDNLLNSASTYPLNITYNWSTQGLLPLVFGLPIFFHAETINTQKRLPAWKKKFPVTTERSKHAVDCCCVTTIHSRYFFRSRANANLEYLKNVMYQYLTTDKDQSARNRMLSAVTAMLQFSPEEIKKVARRWSMPATNHVFYKGTIIDASSVVAAFSLCLLPYCAINKELNIL